MERLEDLTVLVAVVDEIAQPRRPTASRTGDVNGAGVITAAVYEKAAGNGYLDLTFRPVGQGKVIRIWLPTHRFEVSPPSLLSQIGASVTFRRRTRSAPGHVSRLSFDAGEWLDRPCPNQRGAGELGALDPRVIRRTLNTLVFSKKSPDSMN